MIDPRVRIVRAASHAEACRLSRGRFAAFLRGSLLIDEVTGRELELQDFREANVIAERRFAGFFFIHKNRYGKPNVLRLGIPRPKTPMETMSSVSRDFGISAFATLRLRRVLCDRR